MGSTACLTLRYDCRNGICTCGWSVRLVLESAYWVAARGRSILHQSFSTAGLDLMVCGVDKEKLSGNQENMFRKRTGAHAKVFCAGAGLALYLV